MASNHEPYRHNAHAVVIGIDRYRDPAVPNLHFARADAEAIYAVLTDPELGRFGPENVALLLDEEATRRKIHSALGTQLPRRATEEDTVCIFYAGHGAPELDPKTQSRDGMEKYLVPHDAEAEDLHATGISMDYVEKLFHRINANQVLFFIDSCYSGSAGGRSFQHPKYQTRALSDEFLESLGNEGRVVVTACGVNEVSLEARTLGHGVFTYHLVEGLKGAADADGNGLVTLDELYSYVYRNVERQARAMGGSMKPIKSGQVRGEVYLTQYEREEDRKARHLNRDAEAAFAAGDLDTASRLWQEVKGLLPHHQEAMAGLAAIDEAKGQERDKREKEKQEWQAELDRRGRVLLDHRGKGELAPQDYNRAMELLERDLQGLAQVERQIRSLVDDLTEGKITVSVYLTSIRLLTSSPAVNPDGRASGPPSSGPEHKSGPSQEPEGSNDDGEATVAVTDGLAGTSLQAPPTLETQKATGESVAPEVPPMDGGGAQVVPPIAGVWKKPPRLAKWARYGVYGLGAVVVVWLAWIGVDYAVQAISSLDADSAQDEGTQLAASDRSQEGGEGGGAGLTDLSEEQDKDPDKALPEAKTSQRQDPPTKNIDTRPTPPLGRADRESTEDSVPTLPRPRMIALGPGRFSMGSHTGDTDEKPVHTVQVPRFQISRTEVTVAQYQACVTAGQCRAPSTGSSCNWNQPDRQNHPVNCVSWEDAKAYVQWLGEGYRLPTEAEWEYAARGGDRDVEYPWGNEPADCQRAVIVDCNPTGTLDVCSKPKGNTPQGLCDMAGNVWEWLEDDWHNSYQGAPADGSAWTDTPRGSSRVFRGGSWGDDPLYARVAGRIWGEPGYRHGDVGFRVARSLPSSL